MKESVNLDQKLPVDSHHQRRVQENQKLLDCCNGSAGSRAEQKSWTIQQNSDAEVVVKTKIVTVTKAEQPLQSIENRDLTAAKMDHSTSDKNKSEAMSISPPPSREQVRICLVGAVAHDKASLAAAHSLKLPFVLSETGAEYLTDTSTVTYFVLNQFDGPVYDTIYRSKHRILGPPALQQAARSGDGIPHNNRPIYNYCMRGVITCFTGIRKKDELTRLVDLIHSMGGSIRKDMNTKVTHLICNTTGGEKYQYAMTFRLAVVRPSWVVQAWQNRNDPNFAANVEEFTKSHRLKAFEGQKICFFGFPPEEHQHMVDVLKMNGGIPADLEDPECSHVVVDEHVVTSKPEPKNTKTHIVKADWFWYTIQNGYADEGYYLFAILSR